MERKLSERKQKILKAVVEEYIKNATPVSSGEIQRKYFDDISSATIRSELSALEDMGYLVQPHTSAGRMPTPQAYKLYFESFLGKRRSLRKQDVALIDACFSAKFREVEEIVRTTARVISDVTNYTSVIVLNDIEQVAIKEVKLVGLDNNTALVIIITDNGVIRDKVVELTHGADEEYLREATMLLNKIFAGRTVRDLKSSDLFVDNELREFRELFDNVLGMLEALCSRRDEDVFFEGAGKLLDYPDTSLESAKKFLSLIDSKEGVKELISDAEDVEFTIKIGKDETGGMEKCAIVTAKYKVNGKEIGHAGVIGPERMDYARVMSVLRYVGEALDSVITPKGLPKKGEDNE